MEHKSFLSFVTKIDAKQGIVEHLVAVMGNKDMGDDVIWPGAFTKTLNERGNRIRVLDLHKTDSIMRVLGKPISLREIGAAELPTDVKTKYPDANGALAATTQFNLKTPEGLGAFERINAGDINEWSFGYDAITPDYGKWSDGKTVRNLREIRLYEYSPVIFGMNEATTTLSAKSNGDKPTEEKPWDVVHEGDKWRVYKLDAEGKPMGEPLGEFDTEEEARAQQQALYANEPDAAGKATWSAADINDLPDSSFLYIDPDAATGKDDAGKTVPRSARYFPYKDADGAIDLPHLRNAIARIPQSNLSDALKERLQNEARAILEKETSKAITFQAALGQEQQERTLDAQRWTLDGALSDSLYSIVRDPTLDAAAKTEAYRQSLAQYTEALVSWFGQALAANYWNDAQIAKALKAGRRLKGDMMTMIDQMAEILKQLRDWANYQDTSSSEDTAPADEQAAKTAAATQAGPSDVTPTSDLLRLIEIEQEQIKLLEV